MSELANNKSIRKEVQDLGETLGITPSGKTNQQKIRSIGEQASDGTYATKEYVNTLMSGALKRAIVEALPTEDIDTNTIYMVLDETASAGNVYNEYLYINSAWELIGSTAVSGTTSLYLHNIVVSMTAGFKLSVQIANTNNTAITAQGLIDYLYSIGCVYTDNGMEFYSCMGYSSTNYQVVNGICSNTDKTRIRVNYFYLYSNQIANGSGTFGVSDFTITDTVTQIF